MTAEFLPHNPSDYVFTKTFFNGEGIDSAKVSIEHLPAGTPVDAFNPQRGPHGSMEIDAIIGIMPYLLEFYLNPPPPPPETPVFTLRHAQIPNGLPIEVITELGNRIPGELHPLEDPEKIELGKDNPF